MKITAIKQQVKRTDRFSVFVDGKYGFSFSQAEIVRLGLKIGREFSSEELEKLKENADLDKAYDRALNLLSLRQRSQWEVEQYLKRKKYGSLTIDSILNKLSIAGYIGDKKFAEAWVRNRRLLKPTSLRRLQLELRSKRVSNDIIDEVLQADETNEREVLRELVQRKKKRYPDKLKLVQYLIRQGFNYGDIKQMLAEK